MYLDAFIRLMMYNDDDDDDDDNGNFLDVIEWTETV